MEKLVGRERERERKLPKESEKSLRGGEKMLCFSMLLLQLASSNSGI